MGNFKSQIARSLSCNCKLNRKILKIKRSWDEVERLLCAICPCKSECRRGCGRKRR